MLKSYAARVAAASEHDFDDSGFDPARRARKLMITVGLVALSMLMLEVLLAKLYAFFLGTVSSFIAIPVAMLGLSIGALALHLRRKPATPQIIPLLLPLLGAATLFAFVALFFLFNHVFNLTHYWAQNPRHDALKTISLTLVFVPPFAVAGVLLSVAFKAAGERVGRLYAVDLIGSASACLITPLALHFTDLPIVICLLLGLLLLANLAVFTAVRRKLLLIGGTVLAALTVLGAFQLVFVEHPDPNILGSRYSDGHTVRELAHRWNEVSRVALLKWSKPGQSSDYRVLHDDGVSNVKLRRYDPKRVQNPEGGYAVHRMPFLLDTPPKKALVIFAGAGRDMVRMLEEAHGDLDITGVEINGLVPWIVTRGSDRWNLKAFYALPNVHFEIDEGRAFLNRSTDRYDLIFMAANGAQTATRTGHVRKFLDTYETAEAYLDHLAPGGVLVFFVQPWEYKLEMFKRLFAERGLAPFGDTAIMLGGKKPRFNGPGTLMVKPDGFSPGEVQRIRQAWSAPGERAVYYAPGQEHIRKRVRRAFLSPPGTGFVPNDDRPYERPVKFDDFELFPDKRRFKSLGFSMDWVKIFTMGFFSVASVLIVGAFYARARGPRRLPLRLLAYFLVSGISYMCAQIGLMAKLELFMGKPLYAIAVVLAGFLLANGLGSAWIGRLQAQGRPPSILWPALGALITVPATLWVVDALLADLLGLAIGLKALLALLTLAPLATVLGMFYPLGVGLTVREGLNELVPMTFGLATLSSVIGSTVAMVWMINVGFTHIILSSMVGYTLLAVGGIVGLLRAR